MSQQRDLFATEPPPLNELDRKYRLWRADHPEVLTLFVRFARQLLERGRPFGVWLLANRVRWEVHMGIVKDSEGFRINNNLLAYLARDLIRRMPALKPLVEIRKVASERDEAVIA